MIDARYRELDPAPMSEAEVLDWARDTGGLAAQLAAQVLDPATDAKMALAGGSAWALGKRLAETPGPAADLPEGDPRRAQRLAQPQRRGLPAVAHAALAGRPASNDFARRLRLTIAVARGRI